MVHDSYDVIVLGVGGMGSAALYHLARRGQRVLGLERFALGHDRGSSHGSTRIIRKAYFEHPDYVPLLHRAYALWDELAAAAGEALFLRSGLIMAGPPGDEVLAAVRRTARRHGLDISDIPAAELARRFPALRVPADGEALYEADAGILRVEACVRAHAELAQRHGATLLTETPAQRIQVSADGVVVETARGRFAAGALVVCGGAFSDGLLRDLALPLTLRRKVQLWYDSDDESLRRERGFPAFLVSDATLGGTFYGFPVLPELGEAGLKVAEHSGGATVAEALAVDRAVYPEDERRIRDFLQRYLPSACGPRLRHQVCLYAMTPDEHFIIDRHPRQRRLVFAAGFSGHGFKFAAVVGEALADLASEGKTSLPIDFLRLGRFPPDWR